MTTILCATIFQTAMLLSATEAKETNAESYTEARKATLETGKPMVVMVTTDWCPPCQVMKKTILPRVREHGLLRKVVFTVVNPDQDRKLADEITGGGPIPQLVMFRKTSDGWVRKKLVGGQTVENVEKFINEGLVSKDMDKKTEEPSTAEHDPTPASVGDHAAHAQQGEQAKHG